jgi:hypothetical protein
MHPNLYTPFERYIMWIIKWVVDHGTGNGLTAPAHGVFDPMWITLSQSGWAFFNFERSARTLEDSRKAFFESIEGCRMSRGKGVWRTDLVAIGEKNPPEYAEPSMFDFIMKVHPDAKFIHLVRHPKAVALSRMGFEERYGDRTPIVPWYWYEDLKTNLEVWVQIERWVLEAKKRAPVLTIRYEDLVAAPSSKAKVLLKFLGANSTRSISASLRAPKENGNDKYDLEIEEEVDGLPELMEMYSYG